MKLLQMKYYCFSLKVPYLDCKHGYMVKNETEYLENFKCDAGGE